MIHIDIQVSRSKVKVKGQAYSAHVGEGGHLCFTNSYIWHIFILNFIGSFVWQRITDEDFRTESCEGAAY